jgi:hypothetical protein
MILPHALNLVIQNPPKSSTLERNIPPQDKVVRENVLKGLLAIQKNNCKKYLNRINRNPYSCG